MDMHTELRHEDHEDRKDKRDFEFFRERNFKDGRSEGMLPTISNG